MTTTIQDTERVLVAVQPLVRHGTLLDRVRIPYAESAELHDGSGGTHFDGAPYLEAGEKWPECAHGSPMRCVLQADGRDRRHPDGFDGIYVVYACNEGVHVKFASFQAGQTCSPVIRYYSKPSKTHRSSESLLLDQQATKLVPVRSAEFLPPANLFEQVAGNEIERVSQLELDKPWAWVYQQLLESRHYSNVLYDDHLGGWHVTNSDRNVLPPLCRTCAELLHVVIQLEWGDGNLTLWACPHHPDEAFYRFHK